MRYSCSTTYYQSADFTFAKMRVWNDTLYMFIDACITIAFTLVLYVTIRALYKWCITACHSTWLSSFISNTPHVTPSAPPACDAPHCLQSTENVCYPPHVASSPSHDYNQSQMALLPPHDYSQPNFWPSEPHAAPSAQRYYNQPNIWPLATHACYVPHVTLPPQHGYNHPIIWPSAPQAYYAPHVAHSYNQPTLY